MTRTFVYTASFRRCWERMGLHDAQLNLLEQALLEDPKLGDVIERKMRVQLRGRGKRGGGRVIYVDMFERKNLYLLFAYPKNVQEDLLPEQKKAICAMIEAIKEE